ncbi:MAG: phosphoribosylglycinamide formyltransferase [Balneolaceae bacterium]|nr:phosphoribosylglycinamide formyltransferase [Balneolaceae bacterium]
MPSIVVFASGSGSNFQAVIDAARSGRIPASVAGLITDREGIRAIERAREAGIPVRVIPPGEQPGRQNFAGALLDALNTWKPDLVVLAGYLRRIPPSVIRRYPGRIINIHPALLPDFGGEGFYGMRVHRAVLEAGRETSGCTVHRVTENYDEGPILEQVTVPVHPCDTPETLAARVLEKEHELLPRVIRNLLEGERSSASGNSAAPSSQSQS